MIDPWGCLGAGVCAAVRFDSHAKRLAGSESLLGCCAVRLLCVMSGNTTGRGPSLVQDTCAPTLLLPDSHTMNGNLQCVCAQDAC